MLRVVEAVPGAADAQVEVLSGAAQLEVRLDREALARYGLHVGDVQEFVETAVAGSVVTQLIDGARRFPVVVRFPPERRADAAALAAVPLTAPGGEHIPLGRIAEIAAAPTPEAINHENRRAPAGGPDQRAGPGRGQLRRRGGGPDRGAR